MTELKKAVVFDEAAFSALQAKAPEQQALAPAQQFEQADFATETAAPDNSELQKTSKQQLFWWGGALASLSVLALWQWGTFVADSWQAGLLQGSLVSALTFFSTALLARFGYQQWRLGRTLQQRQQWRMATQRLEQSVQFGEAMPMCQQIQQSMQQQAFIDPLWQQFTQQHKAEFSDAEVLKLFDTTVLTPLDSRVEQQIRQAAMQTGVAVALSPFALADMLLVLWRGSLMLREISLLYGAPMGKLRSLRMIKKCIKTLFFTGASEMAIDVGSDLLGAELTGKLSARLGQGVLAAILVARLGRFAQQELRPLPAKTTEPMLLRQIASDLLKKLKPGTTAN